ncbi:tyrosine-protein phosphatase-like [Heterodontus francisci]|uniref:tyrosine-protein phosphatase-like n=1 Tax=Heterodontus francisci TaxID=7792 RepID=UPI00355B7311
MPLSQLKGIANFRQLHSAEGPLQIYRSSFPDDATKEDVKYLKDVLGIQLIIDFRHSSESSSLAGKPLDAAYKSVTVTEEEIEDMKSKGTIGQFLSKDRPYVSCHLGFTSSKYNNIVQNLSTSAQKAELSQLSPQEQQKYVTVNILNPRGLTQQYIDLCETSQTYIWTIFKLLSDPKNVPALIHCTAGKDRTGIVSALIQTCVGLPRDKIFADYEATTEGLKKIYDDIYEDYVNKKGMTEEFLSSTKETMDKLLTHIDKNYGSVQGYLTANGFNPNDQEKMKKNITIK